MDNQLFHNQNRSFNNGDKMWIMSHQGRGPGHSAEDSGIGLVQLKEAHGQLLGSDDSSEMDVSESYTRSEVACGTSKNLHFKAVAVQDLLPAPPSNQLGGDVEMDIDKKQALRKLAERIKSQEDALPQVSLLNIQHKKRPQKRTSTSVELTHEDLQALNAVKLKTSEELLKIINLGQPPTESVCITYNDKCFSGNDYLQPMEILSSGTFGDVLKVLDKLTGKTLIQKEIKRKNGRIEVDSNEVMIPTKFTQVQNIAQVYGLVWTGAHLRFILEDAGISLRLLVDSPANVILLDGALKKESIMRDMFCAISHLAKHMITHCDIKPENVCVDIQSWTAKLIDFGSSKTMMDAINYKGLTPEYLDPLVNKIICAMMEKKKVPALHRLNEKDDVFSASLCFLFMIKKCHPLIHFITGQENYPPNMTPNIRLQVLKAISQLNEQQMIKLRDVPMSDHMKALMVGTLSLDRDQRWTATQALLFIDGEGGSSVQPPQKQYRPDSQPSYVFKLEDLSMYVDVRNKNANITVPAIAKIAEHNAGPRSPEAALGQEGLGINMKANFLHHPQGQILCHPKLQDFPRQEGPQLLPNVGASAYQISTDSRQPHAGRQQGQPPQMMFPPSRPSPQDQESKEYEDLVSSFQTKMPTPKMSRRLLPAENTQQPPLSTSQGDQPATCTRQEVARNLLPVTSIFSAAEVQQRSSGTSTAHNLRGVVGCNEASQGLRRVVMQDDPQPYLDPGSVVRQDGQHAVQGLSGRVVRYEGRCDQPVGNIWGNLPDMDALFPGEEEQFRPKLKGVRRFRTSHD